MAKKKRKPPKKSSKKTTSKSKPIETQYSAGMLVTMTREQLDEITEYCRLTKQGSSGAWAKEVLLKEAQNVTQELTQSAEGSGS